MSYSCKDLANCIKYFPGYKLPAFKADLRWSLAYYYIVLKEGKNNAYKRVFNFSIYCLAEVWSVYIKRRKNCDLSSFMGIICRLRGGRAASQVNDVLLLYYIVIAL